MIRRRIEDKLRQLARKFPAVSITGPRQSGKTTLCRAVFPRKPYVTFEALDLREFATRDPRGFLAEYRQGAVLDEVQRVPEILSYLQGEIDDRPIPGRFILTGSANFALLESVSQSLAGRTALLTLLPLDLDEVRRFPEAPKTLLETLLTGSYPAIFDRRLDPNDWYSAYVGNYVERDVRQILNIVDLAAFQTFLRLCAGRSAQLLNLSALGADCGITHATARAWMSVLEASYVTFRLPPFHANLTARLVKTPKLHFFDTGLLCFLLGIQTAEQLHTHPLRGAVFETWVASELFKHYAHSGVRAPMSFYRDRKGLEVDILLEQAREVIAVEAKSGQTVAADFFTPLRSFSQRMAKDTLERAVRSIVVYGGEVGQRRTEARVLPWEKVHSYQWVG